MSHPIILIHGYSDVPASFANWKKATTLVELKLNREPEPPRDVNKVAWFQVDK